MVGWRDADTSPLAPGDDPGLALLGDKIQEMVIASGLPVGAFVIFMSADDAETEFHVEYRTLWSDAGMKEAMELAVKGLED